MALGDKPGDNAENVPPPGPHAGATPPAAAVGGASAR